MTEHQKTHSKQYERARSEFEGLKIEDKAVFLIEATVTTIARGVEVAGRALADELDTLFRSRPPEAAGTPEEAGAAASEPGAGSNDAGKGKGGKGKSTKAKAAKATTGKKGGKKGPTPSAP